MKNHGMIFIWGNILPVLPTLIIFTSLPKKEMMKAVMIAPCSILLSLWNCLITMKYVRIYWSLFMKDIATIKRNAYDFRYFYNLRKRIFLHLDHSYTFTYKDMKKGIPIFNSYSFIIHSWHGTNLCSTVWRYLLL